MKHSSLRVIMLVIQVIVLLCLLFSCGNKPDLEVKKDKEESLTKDTSKKVASDDIKPRFPTKVGVLALQEGASLYDKDTIFDLIDGGADIFLKQGFTQVFAGVYKGEGNVEIEAHLYYFDKETGAKSIFSTKQKDLPEATQEIVKKDATAMVSELGNAVLILNVTSSGYPKGQVLNELAQAIAEENGLKASRSIVQYKK